MKKPVFVASLFVLCTTLCLAQNSASPAQNSLTQPGQDDFGRPVEPVSNAPVQQPQPVPPNDRQAFDQSVKDVFFDFNKANLTADDRAALEQDAQWLKAHPEVSFTIEGDADQRGSIPYNLFLSDERALAARDELVKLGVPEKQILFATGWGKLYPVCQQDDESCWSKQRRAHFAPWSAEAAPNASASAEIGGDAVANALGTGH